MIVIIFITTTLEDGVDLCRQSQSRYKENVAADIFVVNQLFYIPNSDVTARLDEFLHFQPLLLVKTRMISLSLLYRNIIQW